MKKVLLAIMIFAAAPSLVVFNAQSAYANAKRGGTKIPASQVPKPVRKSFNQTFPTATQVEWEYTAQYYGAVTYTASFKLSGQKWQASFSPDGTLISSGPKL